MGVAEEITESQAPVIPHTSLTYPAETLLTNPISISKLNSHSNTYRKLVSKSNIQSQTSIQLEAPAQHLNPVSNLKLKSQSKTSSQTQIPI
jgi:hypothetical protein